MTLGHTVEPPATIGMLGGGQLGRYALMAATTMGYRTIVLDPARDAPAGVVANRHLVADYGDPDALGVLVDECDVVTTEFENPPAEALERLARDVLVAPAPRCVAIAQDRIAEKNFLRENDLPVGPFAVVGANRRSGSALAGDAARLADAPAVLKTARLGYDGKGQRRIDGRAAAEEAWREMGSVPCVIESLLHLDLELSVLLARSRNGTSALWPIAENQHVDGILDVSVVPARVAPTLAERAASLAITIADRLEFVGVLAVEMFVVGDDLFVNELAPRPHNSGHWTLDVAVTSQFEQQVRAVCGAELGETTMTAPAAAMANLLGDRWTDGEPRWAAVLAAADARLHLYGKAEARPGRKMGHLTVRGDDPDSALARVLHLRDSLSRLGTGTERDKRGA